MNTSRSLSGGWLWKFAAVLMAAATLHGAEPPSKSQAVGVALPQAAGIVLPSLDFREATMKEATEFLRQKALQLDPKHEGLNIVLRVPEGGEPSKITLSLREVPLSDALHYVAEQARMKVTYGPYGALIEPKAKDEPIHRAPAGTAPKAEGAAAKRAASIITPHLEFREATLIEGVEFLQQKGRAVDKGFNIVVAAPSPADAKPTLTLQLSNIPLLEALKYVATLANFDVVEDPNALVLVPKTK